MKLIVLNLAPRLYLEDDWTFNICNIKGGKDCCKYLVTGQHGFACAKLEDRIRVQIDFLAHKFTAKGNNCPGLIMLDGTLISRN
jgi:hypothetical protein